LKEIQADAVICAGYKWLLGPYSLGLAYYGDYFNAGKPIEESWINRQFSEDFSSLVNYQGSYKEKANRYSVGEHSNFILVPMLSRAIGQIENWGVANIQAYCKDISSHVVEDIKEIGCYIEDDADRVQHLFGIGLPEKMNTTKLKEILAREKVYVSFRGDFLRIASHLFNTSEDFDKLMHCLKEAMDQDFARGRK